MIRFLKVIKCVKNFNSFIDSSWHFISFLKQKIALKSVQILDILVKVNDSNPLKVKTKPPFSTRH